MLLRLGSHGRASTSASAAALCKHHNQVLSSAPTRTLSSLHKCTTKAPSIACKQHTKKRAKPAFALPLCFQFFSIKHQQIIFQTGFHGAYEYDLSLPESYVHGSLDTLFCYRFVLMTIYLSVV